MGIVYRMFDTVRRHFVALKSLPRLDVEEVYWLKAEFRALVDVRHPNLVELFDLVVDAEHCFFTMEWIDGVDLAMHASQVLGIDRAATPASAFDAITPCIRAVVEGIAAVHRSGKLHRDVKPSNVMVARHGRVALLDFGLTTPLRALQGGERNLGGTISYMSPEELFGHALSPAADWYSLGVVGYELLTGMLPFESSGILDPEDRRHPVDVRRLAPHAPEHLAKLTMDLLQPDPSARPDQREILARLQPDAAAAVAVSEMPTAFVGRAAELARLAAAFALADDRVVSLHVQGESGIGKSMLLQQFCDRLGDEHGALVLTSRCHPYESVPYKALDGVIDALASHLSGRDVNAAPLAPVDVAELVQLFPALGRIPAFATAERSTAWDAVESRRRGAKALKALLARLAVRRPLVIWIDDLQWGDADSAVLLRALLAPPELGRLLLLLSYREDEASVSPMLASLQRVPLETDPTQRLELRLGALPAADAHELALRLLGTQSVAGTVDVVARQGAGSPFLIHQLAQHRQLHRDAPADEADIVRERLAALGTTERGLLELACVAGTDLAPDVLLDAAGLTPTDRSRLTMLRAESLLRLSPHVDHETIQPYHDRIREAVLAGLAPDRLRAHHAALAGVLAASPNPDPETLFRHYLGAGDVGTAAVHLERAADRAAETLAFERAALLYGRAGELASPGPKRIAHLTREAEALQNAGRTADAGARFRMAAEQSAEHDPAQVAELQRRAAECLLRSGHVDEGLDLFWSVMQGLGLSRPRSDAEAFVRALALRLPYFVGPLRRTPIAGVTPATELRRLDAIWRASMSLTMARHAHAAYLSAKFIRLGLASKEPWVLARALGWEGALENTLGGRYFQGRAQRLLARMDRIVEQSPDHELVAFAHAVRGSCAWTDGYFREAYEECTRAIEALRRCAYGLQWEEAVSRAYALHALGFLGDMATLSRELALALDDAIARGDVFAANFCRVGQQAFCHLAADDVDRALAMAEEARASLPAGPYHTTHYHLLASTVQAELYRDRPGNAWEAVLREWPRLEAAQLLRFVLPRTELLYLRARAALALLASPEGRPNAAMLFGQASAAARRIRRTRTRPALAFASAIEAGVARQQGNLDRMKTCLEAAVEGFRATELGLHMHAAKWRLGQLVGGDGGRALRAEAERHLAEQVRRPETIVRTLLPATERRNA